MMEGVLIASGGRATVPGTTASEMFQSLKSFRRQMEKIMEASPGGSWRPCMSDGYPGVVYDVPGRDLLAVIRLEAGMFSDTGLRYLTELRDSIGFIVPGGG